MSLRLIRCLSLLCLGVAFSGHAQSQPPSCQVHVDGTWLPVGAGNLEGCLAALEARVPDYNAQGFKFGLWGTTLLSADHHYFYQSADQGTTWSPVRLKAAQAAATTPATRSVPVIQRSASDVINSVAADAQAAGMALEPAAGMAPAMVDTPAPAMQTAVAPVQADGGERRACSIAVVGGWQKRVNLTLQECARELDRSPVPLDSNGFKYGYWSGTFLAASQTQVLKSQDRSHWEPVLNR